MRNMAKALCICLILMVLSTQALAASDYVWPTDSHILSRNYAKHSYKAIDILASADAPVYASRSGKVYAAYTGCRNWNGYTTGACKDRGLCDPNCGYYSDGYCNNGFGNGVIIQHDDGTYAHYAHFSEVCVKRGDYVSQGQKIGTVGNYGYSNGAHLHFELHNVGINPWKGTCINPEPLLNGKNLPPVNVATTTADTITETSAILRGSFTATGARATECGMRLGTSKSNMTKLGSDAVNTSGTSMFYSTVKYGRPLEPGTTYYYQAYAVVGGQTWKGEIESFTTLPSSSAGISLDRSNITMPYGTCTKLTATTTPKGQSVEWTSSKPSVATVSDAGVLAAIKAGSTQITARMQYEGKTYSATCSVTVGNDIDLSVKSPTNVAQTTARVNASCAYSGTRPSSVGLYLGTSKDSMSFYGSDDINHNKNPFDIWYNLSGLSAGTTYYYQFYAVTGSGTVWTEVESFKTNDNVGRVDLSVKSPTNIAQTTARVNASCAYSGTRPSSVGLYLGTSKDSVSFWRSDDINHNKNPFDIWYNLSGLSAGTTYYYQFYAVTGSGTVWTMVNNFTTAAAATTAPTVNTRTAVVVNTNGSYLAINDRAAASPKYSNQIGRVPPGGTVTVYPDKTNGNWYYIEYSGVSGYAYSKYLSLQ